MNRVSPRGRTVPRRINSSKPGVKIKESKDTKVPHTPLKLIEKTFAERSCYVKPNNSNFGQNFSSITPKYSKGNITQQSDLDQFYNLMKNRHGYKPRISTMTHLKELKKVPCSKAKVLSDGSYWQNVEDSDDVDKIFSALESLPEPADVTECCSKHIFISETPRVKIIAKKLSKYKQGKFELRRLDERVACVEYDIFRRTSNDKVLKPVQKMKAYFLIKSVDNDCSEKQEPPNIKKEFEVSDKDFEKIKDNEIEFIDENIEENKSYLKDCRRILKRKQVINAQKNKTSLDLQSLYEMAKRDRPLQSDYSSVNFLSNAGLQEVKDLILKQCTSSLHGFRRRKIKQKEKSFSPDIGIISERFMAELLTITKNLNV